VNHKKLLKPDCRMLVGSDVHILVTMKSTVFWVVTPCKSVESQPRRNVSSSGSKNKPSKKRLLGVFFDLDDGGDMFLRNVG
jgi:hypothetical protein